MRRTLSHLTFEEWVAYVFDRPVKDPAWCFDMETDWWEGSPHEQVDFLTKTFQNAAAVLHPYTDEQLNQGLWFLASNGASDYMFAFLDPGVDWRLRQAGLRSMRTLYQACFATRCTPDHAACQEATLHGLGHWKYVYPDRVAAIIQAFLKRSPNLRPELRHYASMAKQGHVQ